VSRSQRGKVSTAPSAGWRDRSPTARLPPSPAGSPETDEIMASPGRDLTVEQAVLDDRWAALFSEAHRVALGLQGLDVGRRMCGART